MFEIGKALDGFLANFPNRIVARVIRTLVFPFGIGYKMPDDDIAIAICTALAKPGVIRDRLTHLCFIGQGEDDATGLMESAFVAMHQAQPVMKKIYQAQRDGKLGRKLPLAETITQALAQQVISDAEAAQLTEMNRLRFKSISVDSFKPGVLSAMTINKQNAA